ncbi:MAG: ABC transporter permease [Gemmatimonadetes bacterium]|nr:ABC transporter permease [Gemmatimonadota bacterium]MDA1103009.1 ABC transporter permease [Gemmatimonadota bacterium]
MMRTVRLTVRSLLRTPGYTVAFVLTLGLGIGLNTAIFSVINGVLLSPLPYPDADRIVYLKQPLLAAGVDNTRFSFEEVQDYREQSQTLDQFVEYGDWTFTVVGDEDPHRAVGGLVTANYFEVLAINPAVGRSLGRQDDGQGAEPVMVLTHDYWTRVFGADPDVIGTTVRLYAFSAPKVTRIVGVLEPGTHYTETRKQDFFVNYATNDHYISATMQDARNHRMTDVFARLKPGQSPAAAQAELESLHGAMRAAYAGAYPPHLEMRIQATLWQDELTSEARPTLIVLMGTVALVLLLACANVANLTLTRIVRRERELTVRAALGAGRTALRNQLLTENLILSLAGAGLGLVLAVFGMELLVEYANRFTVRTGEIGIDLPVLGFTIVVAVVVAVLLAWAPSLPSVHSLGNAAGAAGGARGGVGLSRKYVQNGLVVSQLVLSFTLLIGAGLMVRSLINLTQVDTGLAYENVVTMQAPNITGLDAAEDLILMDRVVEEIGSFPGVRAAAYASRAPFEVVTLQQRNFRVEDLAEEGLASPMMQVNTVSPDYFGTVGVPMVQGRVFLSTDVAGDEPVAIINERMAMDLFGNESPINRRISGQQFNGEWGEWNRIVGVAANTREYGLAVEGAHTIYLPAAQGFPGPAIIVATAGEPGPVARRVSEIVKGLDADRPVDNVATLTELRTEDIAANRLNAALFSAFAVLALLIAAIGVLGVLAFAVSQRTREFGVRMALGAQQRQVLGMVLREGAILAGAALVIGVLAARALSGFLVELLYEVNGTDPATYAGVGLVLATVAIVASYVPARRATRVEPIAALRSE